MKVLDVGLCRVCGKKLPPSNVNGLCYYHTMKESMKVGNEYYGKDCINVMHVVNDKNKVPSANYWASK